MPGGIPAAAGDVTRQVRLGTVGRMRGWLPVLVVASALLTACGSSSSPSSSGTTTSTVATVAATPAGVNPSASARMICGSEVQKDLSQVLGARPTTVTPPTWVDHRYSCTYVFPTGRLSLSVKELDSAAQTTSYFDHLGTQLGRRRASIPLGQGDFATNDGSVVARKDWKVLDVDVSGLPTRFGRPSAARADVAVETVATIMGCWSGA
jgi:hypothetical protein